MTVAERQLDLVTANSHDVGLMRQVEAFLRTKRPQLVGPDGERLDIPEPIYRLLRDIVPLLAEGNAVAIVPYHQELTTQQAADLLNVSRPHLVKLLEEGAIPFTKTGTHRRVRFSDVISFKQRRSEMRRKLLDSMTALADEGGEYD